MCSWGDNSFHNTHSAGTADTAGMESGKEATVRKRLWKAGGLVAAFILTLTIANFSLPPDKAFDRHMYGHDFLPFYTAGQLIRTGQANHLYDPQIGRRLERRPCQEVGGGIHNEYGA